MKREIEAFTIFSDTPTHHTNMLGSPVLVFDFEGHLDKNAKMIGLRFEEADVVQALGEHLIELAKQMRIRGYDK